MIPARAASPRPSHSGESPAPLLVALPVDGATGVTAVTAPETAEVSLALGATPSLFVTGAGLTAEGESLVTTGLLVEGTLEDEGFVLAVEGFAADGTPGFADEGRFEDEGASGDATPGSGEAGTFTEGTSSEEANGESAGSSS